MTDDDASLSTESAWVATSDRTDYDPLPGDRDADVAVIGGGIAGVTTAAELAAADADLDVALLEADRIIEGVTGKTTAKLTALHGRIYDDLQSNRSVETAEQYASANSEAIEAVADRIERHDIECRFERTPAFTYTTDPDQRERIRTEVEAANEAGLDAEFVEETPLPWDVEAAVRLDDQARFHPRKYLLGLAEAFEADGGTVHEETRVTGIDAGDTDEPSEVHTDRGTVRADSVVMATHFPVLDRQLLFARQYAHRSYVLCVEAADAPSEGMFYRAGEKSRSMRPHAVGAEGQDLLLVTGEGHKSGQADEAERFRRLERWARETFDVESIPYRWSTQDYVTSDRVPLIGRAGPGAPNRYIATGFGGWGLTNGTAAGRVVADLILDRENRFTDLYDPSRALDASVSTSAVGTTVKENLNVGSELVSGWLDGLRADEGGTPAPGEGHVVRRNGEPVAVHRDEDGELHTASAVCPHMGCIVEWNDAEYSWDCPCHGSRFDADGTFIDGPAIDDLPRAGEE
jgi:glycine/D-amino acid oxidase-like deaminating enzyme/nitrite reductase/ring-hydroxylating ferredoxin subunit